MLLQRWVQKMNEKKKITFNLYNLGHAFVRAELSLSEYKLLSLLMAFLLQLLFSAIHGNKNCSSGSTNMMTKMCNSVKQMNLCALYSMEQRLRKWCRKNPLVFLFQKLRKWNSKWFRYTLAGCPLHIIYQHQQNIEQKNLYWWHAMTKKLNW